MGIRVCLGEERCSVYVGLSCLEVLNKGECPRVVGLVIVLCEVW